MAKLATLFALGGLTLAPLATATSSTGHHGPSHHNVIPSGSFDEESRFKHYWAPNYPWGNTQVGSARMDPGQVSLGDEGTLVLTATPKEGLGEIQYGTETVELHYLSGAVHAREMFNVTRHSGYDFSGMFRVNASTKGVWPGVALSGVHVWPPEIDLAEWRGDSRLSFNSWNSSKQANGDDVDYTDETDFHHIKAMIRDINGQDVSIKFFLDGEHVSTQYARDYVGKPMWL